MTAKTKTRRTRTRASGPRRDVEAEVTARIVAALEAGTVPWHQPWRTAGLFPTSASTNRAYRGANLLLLAMETLVRGYSSPYWLTYRQATERGGHVRAGEKGTLVVFWKQTVRPDPESPEPDAVKRGFFLTSYTVFNLEQTEDVTLAPRFAPPEIGEEFDPLVAAEEIWAGYADGPRLRHVLGDSAHYVPALDEITLPRRDQFEDAAGYYHTLFHEGTHSTGHSTRLDRPMINHFATEMYAREELVAELGAAMLLAVAGVEPRVEQSAAYVANWLTALKNDQTLVIKAAGLAQKAVDRVLGANPATEPTEGEAA